MGEKKPVSFGSLVDAMLALEQLRRVSEEGVIMARELGRSPSEQAAQKTHGDPGDGWIPPAEQEPASQNHGEHDDEAGAVRAPGDAQQ